MLLTYVCRDCDTFLMIPWLIENSKQILNIKKL